MIVKKMVEMGKSRGIIYFDELDKCTSKHGHINEITSILIHLTDPNTNKCFQDRFFQGIDFPLNKIIFMFAYNDSSLIDPILLDRFKEIRLKPYSLNDKIKILNDFMIPEICKNIGIDINKIKFSQTILEFLINNYTIEAGVRRIKEIIENILLNLNKDIIMEENKINEKHIIELTIEEIKKILDKTKIKFEKIHEHDEIGIINGMYATESGYGGIIPIQVFKNHISKTSNFEFKLTGTQGKVMKESVLCSYTAAVEYIKRNLYLMPNLDTDIESHIHKEFPTGFHVHTPSTSSPKDGPSAGCAFTCAFISRIINKPIKNYIGMTGEIELTGKITEIGGLPYKLMGSKRAGVKKVFIPKQNKKDLDKIIKNNPNLIDDDFNVQAVDCIDDVFPQII